MAFAKGAFSRHVLSKLKRKSRNAKFGSRHAYRKAKRGLGGKGASLF